MENFSNNKIQQQRKMEKRIFPMSETCGAGLLVSRERRMMRGLKAIQMDKLQLHVAIYLIFLTCL
jgi:hypothetical protein